MTRPSLVFLASVLVGPACTSTARSTAGEDGCTPAALRCRDDELQRCDDDGVAWEVQVHCVPGTCIEGQDSCTAIHNTGGSSSGDGGASGTGNGSSSDNTGGSGSEDGGASGTGTGPSSGGVSGGSGSVGSVGSVGSGGSVTSGGASGAAGAAGTGGTTTGGDAGTGGTVTTGDMPFCSVNACPSDRRCDEEADECVCDGCLIGDSCVEPQTQNDTNSCEVCDPERNTSGYSPDVDAVCGSGATECSGQDTCGNTATCQPNDSADGTECVDGYCEGGLCKVPVFDCIAPSPPDIDLDFVQVVSGSGSPGVATGGTVQSGRYTPLTATYYGEQPSTIALYSFEFDGIFAQAAFQPYPPFGTRVEFAGIFTPVNDTLEFQLQRCDSQNIDVPTLGYTATANGLFTLETHSNGTMVIISYERE